jgi:hypothetical protein
MTDFFNTDYLGGPRPLRLKSGEDRTCEEKAAELLAKSREGVTALSDKRDYLTHDQLANRYAHEVMNSNGFSDESLMSGLFRRSYNPLAGSRPSRRAHSGEE